jgi:hypothetical protein
MPAVAVEVVIAGQFFEGFAFLFYSLVPLSQIKKKKRERERELTVSGINKEVKIPQNIKNAKISITWLSQGLELVGVTSPRVLNGPIKTCAIIAPTFPAAAEIPWLVLLYLVGKHSPGTMKVVAFGPKLKKNWHNT